MYYIILLRIFPSLVVGRLPVTFFFLFAIRVLTLERVERENEIFPPDFAQAAISSSIRPPTKNFNNHNARRLT
jgi:hypothetical protein